MVTRRSWRSETMPLAVKVFPTSLGWVGAAAREGRLVMVVLPLASEAEARAQLPEGSGDDPVLDRFRADLGRYLAGEPVDFSGYPVDLTARSPFHQEALRAVRRIPAGEVRSYAWVAAQVGNAKAARAAGQAMHNNPVPLVVPCHRVVGRGGALTGFGGGLALKRTLLALEGVGVQGGRVV